MTKSFPQSLPCFVISLADSPRRATVVKNLARVGVTNPIFFDAIDAKILTPEQLKPFDDPIHRYFFSKAMPPSTKACSLSHISIWQKMVDEDIPSALVFEDDVEPITADPALLAERINHLVSIQDRLDVVFLNNQNNRPVIRIDGTQPPANGWGVIRRANTCTESYFITQKGAAYLVSHPKRFAFQIDRFMHHWWLHYPNFDVLYHIPAFFRQDENLPSQMNYHIPVVREKKDLLGQLLGVISKAWVSFKKRWLWPFYLQRAKARFKG